MTETMTETGQQHEPRPGAPDPGQPDRAGPDAGAGPGAGAGELTPHRFGQWRAALEQRLDHELQQESSSWSAIEPELCRGYDLLRAFIANGGKRLRPEFAFWAFVGCGGDPDDPALSDLACALEMLHTFALIHDDVMDGSAVRRHAPTVHYALQETHVRGLWRGEPRRFAEGMAVLLGDLAFVYAGRFCSDLPAAVRSCFHDMAVELHVGQYLDLLGAAQVSGVDRSALVTRYKTAKYSVERPLLLGALLAGASAPTVSNDASSRERALSAYGLAVGEAFQLRDDLLGAFGDPSLTGKPIGDDFREGKQTMLMEHARRWVERRNGQGHADRVLLQQFDRASVDDTAVAGLQDLLQRSGACDAVEARIDVLTRTAQRELRQASLSVCAEAALHDLAGRAAWRVS